MDQAPPAYIPLPFLSFTTHNSVEYGTLTAPITLGQQLASPADAGKPPVVSFNGTDATKRRVASSLAG
jgi:hypothetical protein